MVHFGYSTDMAPWTDWTGASMDAFALFKDPHLIRREHQDDPRPGR